MYECYEVCSKGKNHCCCECDLEDCNDRCVGDMLNSDLVKYGDNPDFCFGLVKLDCEALERNEGNDEQGK